MKEIQNTDYLVIGGGIIGMTIAMELKKRFPNKKITIMEKEDDVAHHSSGRNSGVLHAGFYYTADSLKAKLCADGNRIMREFCLDNGLKINMCGKLVVASNEEENQVLDTLKQRGERNGVLLNWVDEAGVKAIDPHAKTFKRALHSPNTASVDPIEVCQAIKEKLLEAGVEFVFNSKVVSCDKESVHVEDGNSYKYEYMINCAGLYADKIAKEFGLSKDYILLPFKGVYLKCLEAENKLKTNIYPVPNLKNPFLGVHYTVTVDGVMKIGPTAMPAFWRENYKGIDNFCFKEMAQILTYEGKLFLKNSFGFRDLAFEEMKKYSKSYLQNLASQMSDGIDVKGFNTWGTPGIRAQLLNTKTLELVQDFVVEKGENSIHVLNAVSPAFTCSIPFASHVVNMI